MSTSAHIPIQRSEDPLCVQRARPDVASATHGRPDFLVLPSVLGTTIMRMDMEGAGAVVAPIPVFPQTKMPFSDVKGTAMTRMFDDGAAILLFSNGEVTVSTDLVEVRVLAVARVEHRARLNSLVPGLDSSSRRAGYADARHVKRVP